MAGILRIYRDDWRNLFKVPVALLLIAALVVLPSIYDWVNVAAVWDPYSNTSGIKIAVTSLDEGASVQDKSFNIGNEVLDSLRHNKSLGWTFVDAKTAQKGVERGDYYASIIIPAEFSQRMAGILEGKLVKPEIEYTVNEKINAIAPKITDKGASSITTQISEHFTETISETVLTALSQVDKKFRSELPIIRKVEKGIFKLEASLPEIETAGKIVLKVAEHWPQIHASAERISTLESKLPEVEQAGGALERIDERWPQISEAVGQLGVLQDKLPELERAALLVSEWDANFGNFENALDKASGELADAQQIVNAAIQALPRADSITAAGSGLGLELQQFMKQNRAAFAAIPPLIKQNLSLLLQTEDSVAQLAQQLQVDNSETQAQLHALKMASARLMTGSNVLDHLLSLFTAMNTIAPGTIPSTEISSVKLASESFSEQATLVNELTKSLTNNSQLGASQINQLGAEAGEGNRVLASTVSHYDTAILPAMKNSLQQLTDVAENAATALQTVPERLPALATLLADTAAAIEYGQSSLTAVQQKLPAIREAVHTAATGITDKTAEFGKFVREDLPRIESEWPAVGDKLHLAADFARHDLPAVEERVRQLSGLIRTGLPRADKGVERAAELVRDDLPLLEDSIRRAAATIRQIKEEVNLEEISQLLSGDIQSKSDFLANPVILKENKLYPIPNYGSAMTPFYVVLSLWVGGTLLISLLRTGVDTGGLTYRTYQLYFGRLLTFLTVGILQALVAVLGNIFILKCYVADKIWFVLFAVLISIVFVTIVFTLVSIFGNLGKGIAIVFMVLQFSSSGGTFPISTTGHFFQALNPFMPFTYAISLMREAVGGILPEVAIRDALYLLAFGVLAVALALTLQKPLERFIRKAAENAERSKLIT